MEWVKAQASNPSGNCVQVSFGPDGVRVRNSRDPDGPTVLFTREEWAAFIAGAKAGEFDAPPAGPDEAANGASEEMLAAEVALLADLAGPGWHAWRGVAGPVTGRGLLYARLPGSSPAAVFSGRDPFTVAEKVAQWKAAREYRAPGR
jgi:hypothetical protein